MKYFLSDKNFSDAADSTKYAAKANLLEQEDESLCA